MEFFLDDCDLCGQESVFVTLVEHVDENGEQTVKMCEDCLRESD